MPDDYATKQDIDKLTARLYGRIPPEFESDIGDIGLIRKTLAEIQKQQTEIADWKRRLTSLPAKIIGDRKSTRLNSSHIQKSRMPSSA